MYMPLRVRCVLELQAAGEFLSLCKISRIADAPLFRRDSTKRTAAGFSGNARSCSAQRTNSTHLTQRTPRGEQRVAAILRRGRPRGGGRHARTCEPPHRHRLPAVRVRNVRSSPSMSRTTHRHESPAARTVRPSLGWDSANRETSSSQAARRAEQCPGTPPGTHSCGSWRSFATRTNGDESIARAPPATWVTSGRSCACTKPARNQLRIHTRRTAADTSARPRRCARLGIIGVRRLCANVALETAARNAHAPAAEHPTWEITGNFAESGGPNRPFKTP